MEITEVKEGSMELSPRQQEVLQRLRTLPTPPAPPLNPQLLRRLPPQIRWGPVMVTIFLLLSLSVLFVGRFHPMIPETLYGPVPLRGGSSMELLAGKTWRISIPAVHGLMILDGPASVELKRVGRSLFSGRFEAEIVLNRGELYLQTDSDLPKSITIKTPLMQVRVTGTQILVGHLPEQGSRLLVKHGVVAVKTPGHPTIWEPVKQGLVLKVTPQGVVQEEQLKKEVLFKDLKSSTGSSVGQSTPSPSSETDSSDLPQLWEMVWHEN